METILITGGTGMIGTRLTELLVTKGYRVMILTRNPADKQAASANILYAHWDIDTHQIDTNAIKQADYIIHLAGANVMEKRWTDKRKQEIINSRTQSSALIVKALSEIPNQVKTVVSASAIGWYGPDTAGSLRQGFTEEAPPDNHFLGETCRLWEESITPVETLGKRLVKLRTGIVLSSSGGALEEFKKPLKLGAAAILGDGKQVISWIQVEDLCSLYIAAIENNQLSGVYNAVAPNPVTNKELVLTLATALRGKYFVSLHVPAVALKMVLGKMSIEVLKSAKVSSVKIEKTGFRFQYPVIGEALRASL